jgi:sterol desaturase/sphingolipid hydroxylase (fatty acid hydroxylase superfamily)
MLELIAGTLAITLGCNLLAAVASYVTLYTNLFAGHRIQTKTYRPDTFWKRLPLIGVNLTVLTVLTVVGLALFHTAFDFQWQGWGVVIVQLLFLVFLDDAYFYFFHRLLHVNSYLYKRIHKVHHRAFAPFPLEYIYVHPLEWMLGALAIPAGLGLIVVLNGSISVHAFWAFAFWRNFHEIDIHSGLRSSLGRLIPFYGTTEHHDRHHMKKTQGNYASTFTIWDRVLNTYIPPTQSPS